MARNDFERHEWMMRILRLRPMTKQEIQKAWKEEKTLNPNGEALSNRTFYNHINAIREKYGVEIVHGEGKEFQLRNDGKTISRTISDLLLKKITKEYNLEGRILYEDDLFENRDRIDSNIIKIAEAMSSNRIIQFKHRRFGEKNQEGSVRTVYPFCLRMMNQLPYLVGYCEEHKEIRTFAVDERITSDITVLRGQFRYPKDFNPETYFETAVGVIPETKKEKPCRILLTATPRGAEYLRSKKFHKSQKELQTLSTNYVVFEYKLAPTIEFYKKLFSYGGSLTVFEPFDVLVEAMNLLEQMYSQHERICQQLLHR